VALTLPELLNPVALRAGHRRPCDPSDPRVQIEFFVIFVRFVV
jgi:hypothetical protein